MRLDDTKTSFLTLEDPHDLPFGGDCWNTKSINHDVGASMKNMIRECCNMLEHCDTKHLIAYLQRCCSPSSEQKIKDKVYPEEKASRSSLVLVQDFNAR